MTEAFAHLEKPRTAPRPEASPLRALRAARFPSAHAAARAAGVPASTWLAAERGRPIALRSARPIARALGLSVAALYELVPQATN
jgi:hypothetical protein